MKDKIFKDRYARTKKSGRFELTDHDGQRLGYAFITGGEIHIFDNVPNYHRSKRRETRAGFKECISIEENTSEDLRQVFSQIRQSTDQVFIHSETGLSQPTQKLVQTMTQNAMRQMTRPSV